MSAERETLSAAQNTDKPARSWWGVNEVKPFDVSLRLPWANRHRPYLALHVAEWGHEIGGGKERRILWVHLMWGRQFTDSGHSKVWQPRGVTGPRSSFGGTPRSTSDRHASSSTTTRSTKRRPHPRCTLTA